MKLIKKLDIFILKNYLLLFVGTFSISLFVVMMQFLWKSIDELVGKGLALDVMAKFFFYAGETLVPLALPLGVLLASLISFGNMGEKFELLAIKAAGIPLIRTLRPLIIFNILIACVSFYFQNNIAPKAEENLLKLRLSILQYTPEADIPEGVFYNGVPGMNLYVKHKDKETGMLYDMIIYNMRDGVNNAHIILADSGRLETSADKTQMLLYMWNGEQFENISNSGLQTRNVPYRRETFVDKLFLIDFDTNFTLQDNDAIGRSADIKRMDQILASVDSMTVYYDSMSVAFYNDMVVRTLYVPSSSRARTIPIDSARIRASINPPISTKDKVESTKDKVESTKDKVESAKDKVQGTKEEKSEESKRPHLAKMPQMARVADGIEVSHDTHVNIDTLFVHLDNSKKQSAIMGAMQRINIATMDIDYKTALMEDGDLQIRRHWVQFWQKITMSLACLIFFFIGAPLGAIIRKGGLGMPVVLAVLIFIIYYIINNLGMRTGRQGTIPVWFGMWLSSLVLIPVAVFLTVKSNNDSMMFNIDIYKEFFRKLLGKRQKRHLTRKEVIINEPNYPETLTLVGQLVDKAREYRQATRHPSPFKYIKYLWRHNITRHTDVEAEEISKELEYVVDILSNTKDRKILVLINSLPILDVRSFRFYRRRRGDMKSIIEYGTMLQDRIQTLSTPTA